MSTSAVLSSRYVLPAERSRISFDRLVRRLSSMTRVAVLRREAIRPRKGVYGPLLKQKDEAVLSRSAQQTEKDIPCM